VAGDVAMAGTAGPDVTQDLPTADDGVTSDVGVPAAPQAEPGSAVAGRPATAARPAPAAALEADAQPGETETTGRRERAAGPAAAM
jgi:hypothetical protein